MNTPNPRQLEAIEESPDSNYRVIAPPGSGKTFLLTHRYRYLVQECSIEPEKILAVTFSKAMADELGARILALNPEISQQAQNQICTIHAFCYRELKRKNDPRNVAKSWQEEKYIKEAIDKYWSPDEEPNPTNVLKWISIAKFHGAPRWADHDIYPGEFAIMLSDMRAYFDDQMKKHNLLTFSDMLYDIERAIQEDEKYRRELQSRIFHVIIDEAQDTSEQALRILTTISQNPGWNKIYEEREYAIAASR